MKISYDPRADAMFIYFSRGKKSDRTEEVYPDFLVDYSGKELISLEILDVSKKLPKEKFGSITLDLPKNITRAIIA